VDPDTTNSIAAHNLSAIEGDVGIIVGFRFPPQYP
jgi:hypothetical protein